VGVRVGEGVGVRVGEGVGVGVGEGVGVRVGEGVGVGVGEGVGNCVGYSEAVGSFTSRLILLRTGTCGMYVPAEMVEISATTWASKSVL